MQWYYYDGCYNDMFKEIAVATWQGYYFYVE